MANLGYVQLARRCNQACVFCSNPPNGLVLSFEEARALVDDLCARGYKGVILTGGEPTLFGPLAELIRYAKGRGLPARMITNGQRSADFDYLASLAQAGLTHLHLSIHSVREAVQDYLTQTPGSLKKQLASLANAERLGITVDINCVINKRNADHLDENVRWLTHEFPFVHHFVWNNLDPSMNPAVDLNDVLPKLRSFEVSLWRAMSFLDRAGKSFRAERVPLCFMAEYAHCSTETRKIVKHEERLVHFLDPARTTFRENDFFHEKGPSCAVCRLSPICAGLFKGEQYYSFSELSPLFLDPEPIRKRILRVTAAEDERPDLPQSPCNDKE